MEDKLFEQKMDTAFREYQDNMWEEINKFSCALMAAYGKDLAVGKMLWKQKKKGCNCCARLSSTWATQGMWGWTF